MEQELADDDLYVPRTPLQDLPLQPPSPRAAPTSRAHDETGDEGQKRFGFSRPTQMQTGAQTRHTGEALAAQSIL